MEIYKHYVWAIANIALGVPEPEDNVEPDQQVAETIDNEVEEPEPKPKEEIKEQKQPKLRRSTRKRRATSKLENCHKKFAVEEEEREKEDPEKHLNAKDLFFFKLSLTPVNIKTTTDEIKPINVRAIVLTKESVAKRQRQKEIHEATLALAVAYHKQHLKKQLEAESAKESVIAENIVPDESVPLPLPVLSQEPDIRQAFEHHDHTYAKLDNREDRKNSLDSGIISPESEVAHDLRESPELVKQDNSPNLEIKLIVADSIQAEYKRLRCESECAKQNYVALKLKENPINIEYNPNKSRNRIANVDKKTAEAREKNNLASRVSRHKKKVYQQHLAYCVEYYTKENAILTSFKEYSLKMEKRLEKAAKKCASLGKNRKVTI